MARQFANRKPRVAGARPAAKWARANSSPDIARAIQRSALGMSSPDDLLALQQTFGNKAVGSMLSAQGKQPPTGGAAIQRWPWDDMFGGGGKAGGGAGGAGGVGGKGGFGGAGAKDGGGAGGAGGVGGGFGGAGPAGKGPGDFPHEEMPWGKMWKMYQQYKEAAKGWGTPATPNEESEPREPGDEEIAAF
jgi:hypothetical protein